MVILLPLLVPLIGLTQAQYGILAGLTVYSVPQVGQVRARPSSSTPPPRPRPPRMPRR